MINYKILNPKFFKKYAEFVGQILDDGVIEFGGGIKMTGMDASKICFFQITLGLDAVEIVEDKNLKTCICMSDLVKVLARFSNPEYLNIMFDEHERIFTVKGKIKNKTKTFTLKELDEDMKDIDIGNLMKISYRAVFKMNGSEFNDLIKDGKIYSEILTFDTKDYKLKFRSWGQHGECIVEMETEQEIYAEEVASYSITFLETVVKAFKDSEVLVMFNKDYPLCLFDKISDETFVRFYLAPRVEDEDDL